MKILSLWLMILLVIGCKPEKAGQDKKESKENKPFLWENATIYFLLTDRFYNGDSTNDQAFNRKKDGAPLRSFMGGDIKGITQKIEEGYFDKMGVNAIWLTPPVEQIHGYTDEGTGKTYGYHGYWTRDWSAIDPNFGTWGELREMVKKAHAHDIRIVLDVVLNHTGPVTSEDSQWPDRWVRTSPVCTFKDFNSTVNCTLVRNLPDIKTEEETDVELPDFLIDKWKQEGRYEQEMSELDDFFASTGFSKAPKYYIIKWLTDFIRKCGVDGFRVDTAKHVEPNVWGDLHEQAVVAFQDWKTSHPDEMPEEHNFYMVGEAYGYKISDGMVFPMSDTVLNFFNQGFKSLINFSFKSDAEQDFEYLFSSYSNELNSELSGFTVLNYLSSHDDSEPFDKERKKVFEAAVKLLLSPGEAQIYYGDETARLLKAEGAQGDANLRSMMNWDALSGNRIQNGYHIQDVFEHWCRLGIFRKEHPAVGAGIHHMVQEDPYTFSRILNRKEVNDTVMIILGRVEGGIEVSDLFKNDAMVKEYYTNQISIVGDGKLMFDAPLDSIILLGRYYH